MLHFGFNKDLLLFQNVLTLDKKLTQYPVVLLVSIELRVNDCIRRYAKDGRSASVMSHVGFKSNRNFAKLKQPVIKTKPDKSTLVRTSNANN
mgnify:CR=1 FL=1